MHAVGGGGLLEEAWNLRELSLSLSLSYALINQL
jgi:hypothetical protein